MKTAKLTKEQVAEIEAAREYAAKVAKDLRDAQEDVHSLTADLLKAKDRVGKLIDERSKAATELKAVALWTVPGLPTDGDFFPKRVADVLGCRP